MDCEDDWQEVYDEVDDVTDLGSNVNASGIKDISELEEDGEVNLFMSAM